MISKELAKKVRYIQIMTNKAVNDVLAGEYHSVFKGQGMEFDEVREYQPGDEIRTIDWNVTARTGHPYVKRFREERELTLLFLVDLSASGRFGSVKNMKNEVATELCALLAFSAIKNNDKVGLVVFTEEVEMFIPPAKGTTHVLRLISELLSFEPKKKGTNIRAGLDFAARILNRRSIVFLISDFFDRDYDRTLRILSRRHDLIALSVSDPREYELPNVGLLDLQDAETGTTVTIDTGSAAIRSAYAAAGRARAEGLRENLRSMDIDLIEVGTSHDYLLDLIRFFKRRERQKR
ncbi:MAG: DUF58 domain-containing protein [Candidatus Hydrogenedentes bacterium]|nr:DUF58 domain-containing protein [Candidatus Hydrogenedentota bacterium]